MSLRSVTGGPHKLLDPCPVNFNKLVGNFAKYNETPHSSHFDIVVCELNRLTMHRTVTSEIHLALTEKQRNDTPRTTCLYLLSAIKRTAPNQSEIRKMTNELGFLNYPRNFQHVVLFSKQVYVEHCSATKTKMISGQAQISNACFGVSAHLKK